LRQRHAFEIRQVDDFALFGRQLIHGLLQRVGGCACGHDCSWVCLGFGSQHGRAVFTLFPCRLASMDCEGGIARHDEQPGPDAGRSDHETLPVAPKRQERLLHRIMRGVVIAQDAIRDPIATPAVKSVDLLERRCIIRHEP